MSLLKKLSYGAATVALFAAAPAAVHAQVTTTDIRGAVTDASGAPISGATVTVVHVPTSTVTSTTTSASGSFNTRGLRAGGPYRVSATAPGFQGSVVEDVYTTLGTPVSVGLTLNAGSADTVTVIGTRTAVADVAVGPSAVFDFTDLQTSPAINRDLKDIIRTDPRIYLDESFNDSIQCAGAHPRFNSLTVDGIGLNDGFGLNGNGYPTERMPFPFDAIQQVSVELAPFDAQYGGFTACNINAVTRSGTNEVTGSVFFDYTDDSFQGNDPAPFDERRYGFSIGAPIVQDRLFIFATYERFEGANQFFRGVDGSGASVEVAGFTQADYDRIRTAAQNLYQYDPGGTPSSTPAIDEKYLIRLDWNITDNHRASLTYNFNDALNRTQSDGDNNEFEYENHLYNRGAELQAYSGQLVSDWNDNFSTEIRLSYNDVDFTQASSNGTDFGEVQIRHNGNTIYLGADDSRHSNDLQYSVFSFSASGNYTYEDHLISAGFERQSYDIFNLFVQHSEGEYRFDSIADFENGDVARVYYGNARGTNNPVDAGATFTYDINTAYLQDEFQINPDLTITAGVRYEWYTSDDTPNANPNFLARNGYSNTETFDGRDLIQPRVGFAWDVNDRLSMRGGVGLFSGGNPNVWLSNSYSNDGLTNVQLQYRPSNGQLGNLFLEPFTQDEGGLGRPIWGVPTVMFDAVANGAANSTVNAIDPNFEIPSELKFAVGGTYDLTTPWFENDARIMVDVLYSQARDAAAVVDATLEQIGTAPDGRPIYRRIDRSDPDCAIDPAGAACSSRGFDNDLILTNAGGGSQFVFSGAIQHEFENNISWSLGYAYVDSRDNSSMTSSVAYSNWTSVATPDINNNPEATSNYEIPHRFTMRASWDHAFFGEFLTRVSLFGQAFQSRPYSFAFDGGSTDMFGDGQDFVHLLYVPLANDPNVVYDPGFDLAGFNAFIDRYGLTRGQITERNSQEGQWNNRFDIRLDQEFRGVMPGHVGSAFITIENVGNLINEDWGVLTQAGFPQRQGVVDATINNAGQYVYRNFFNRTPESVVGSTSFWNVRLGVRYEF